MVQKTVTIIKKEKSTPLPKSSPVQNKQARAETSAPRNKKKVSKQSFGGIGSFSTGARTMGGYVEQNQWKPTVRRGPIAAEYTSPGPASVNLSSSFGVGSADSTKRSSPSYTIVGRKNDKIKSDSPGPKFNTSGIDRNGSIKPKAYTILGRPEDLKKDNLPGPGQYGEDIDKMIDHSKQSAPKYTFGLKPEIKNRDNTPAPNTYNIPGLISPEGSQAIDKTASPRYTFSGRPADPKLPNVPGPAAYDCPSTDIYKSKSPVYSVSYRTPIPMDRTQKPGPGAHSPEKVLDALNTPPRYSFGIKHSPYVGHLPGELKRCPTYEILNEPSSTHKTQQKSTHTSTRTMVHYETGPDGRKTKTTTTITKVSDNKGGPGTTNIKRIQSGTDGKEVVLYDGPGSDRDIDRMMTPTGNAALKNSRTVQTRQVVNHYTTAQVSNNEVKSSHVAESYTSDTKPSSYNYTP